ncbi:hypothetical protein MGYG_03515 [Nannizzia gypsea CBS 118893]|uniref:Clr5 domain-containing protein n=1 Tax=Arthroderma gypseum (strain ATCC MYA-4604 / CBS 118893) TaxID=535722 RepID=E4USE4_ARTGP|nr:hypothetical protein MGYG_03515 [Nannizzia gypsea CBS 118893]EFR00511.1 hypothetical protein MGYG_03515 [Nannizzia gypsea CBS 118893]
MPSPESFPLPRLPSPLPLPRHLPEWTSVKETIRHLYVENGLSIKELMQTMEAEHSFRATRKQYLSRLVKWGFNRNIKAETMTKIALIRERRRRLDGMPTVFTYNGLIVDDRKIERFIREKIGRSQLERMNVDDVSTPTGVTYETPRAMANEDVGENVDEEPLNGERQKTEMPRAITWALGALRPLRYEELATACGIMGDKKKEINSESNIPSWTRGVFETGEDGFIRQTSRAPDILAQFTPTDAADNLILETILKGITDDKKNFRLLYECGIVFERFKSEAPEALTSEPWWYFMEYQTLYWPSHLCRLSHELKPTEESALNDLIRAPICVGWIEALALFTKESFGVVLSRILHIVLAFCNGNGPSHLKPSTISALRAWAKSCQHLVHDWREILSKWPGEIHYIQSAFLPKDNIFQNHKNSSLQYVLPDYNLPKPNMEMSFFEKMSVESSLLEEIGAWGILMEEMSEWSALIEVDYSARRIYYAYPHYGMVSLSERPWKICCISMDTGLTIAEYRGKTTFGDQRNERSSTEAIKAQLAISPDGRYLAYEELVDCRPSMTDVRVFTYFWNIQPTVTLDGDVFGQCFQLNRGARGPSFYFGRTLGFDKDANLVHACGVYSVKTRASVHSLFTTDFLLEIKSAIISRDRTVTAFALFKDSERKKINIWIRDNFRTDVQMHCVYNGIACLLDISTSGRLLALLESPEAFDEDEESTYNLVVLEITSGNRNILHSFTIPTHIPKSKNNHNALFKAFFGDNEKEPVLFVSDKVESVGRVWRKSRWGWKRIGDPRVKGARVEPAFQPLKFSDDGTEVVGIHKWGVCSIDAHNHYKIPLSMEEVDDDLEVVNVMESSWGGHYLYCVDTEKRCEETFKIAGWQLDLNSNPPIKEDFYFFSPTSLLSISLPWIPTPGKYINYRTRGADMAYSSQIVFNNDPDNTSEHDLEYRFTNRCIVCVSADGRYKLAYFPESSDNLVQFDILGDGESNNCLRSYIFHCQYDTKLNGGGFYNPPSLRLQGSFHPTLPIVLWTIPLLGLGFWISDLRSDSRPIFIDDVAFAAKKPSFSQCGRYLLAFYDESSCSRSPPAPGKPEMGVFVVDFKEGVKCKYLWPPGIMNYHSAYAFSHNDEVFVVGFNNDTLLISLRLAVSEDNIPRLQYLMAFPSSHSRLERVRRCGIIHGGFNVIITDICEKEASAALLDFSPQELHPNDAQINPNIPQAVVIRTSHDDWKDTNFRISGISRVCQRGGPIIEANEPLRAPPFANPRSDKMAWVLKPSAMKHLIQRWQLMDNERHVLLEREYYDI